MRQRIRKVLFVIFCLIILWMTILSRTPGNNRIVKLELLWAYRAWIAGKSYGQAESIQNILNIVLFVPFGFLFPKRSWKYLIITVMVFSVVIEMTQYIWILGWCELDDVICNTLGAVIGFRLWLWIGHKEEKKNEIGKKTRLL